MPVDDPPSAHLPNLPKYEYPTPPPGGFPVLVPQPIPEFTPPKIVFPWGTFDGCTPPPEGGRLADFTEKPGNKTGKVNY